jgi:alpha-galactosidase
LVGYGVDFIKADDLTPFPAEVHAIADAIEKAPREIVLSLSPGNDITPLNLDAYRRANMFRITGDVWDDPRDFQKIMDRWFLYQDANTEQCRIDLDMIPFGALQVYAQEAGSEGDEALLAGRGFKRMSNFTSAQKQFFITMLALAASPLMFGGELTMTDDQSFELVTHPEVLACNANNVCGRQVYLQNYIDIRTTPHATSADEGWVGIFNRKTVARHMAFTHTDLGIPESVNRVYSIWDDQELSFEADRLRVFCLGQSVIFLRYGGF